MKRLLFCIRKPADGYIILFFSFTGVKELPKRRSLYVVSLWACKKVEVQKSQGNEGLRRGFKERFWWQSQPIFNGKNPYVDRLLGWESLRSFFQFFLGSIYIIRDGIIYAKLKRKVARKKDFTNLCAFSHSCNYISTFSWEVWLWLWLCDMIDFCIPPLLSKSKHQVSTFRLDEWDWRTIIYSFWWAWHGINGPTRHVNSSQIRVLCGVCGDGEELWLVVLGPLGANLMA